jgi:prepilin-type processing-associated H-X9-DG protein
VATASLASINTPSDCIIVGELGANDAGWGWGIIDTYEGAWTDWVAVVNGQPTHDGCHYDINQTPCTPAWIPPHDCDYTNTNGGGTWDGCGMFPRYRHTTTTNATFTDGHAKSMARGRINWYNNIYPGATGVGPAADAGVPW